MTEFRPKSFPQKPSVSFDPVDIRDEPSLLGHHWLPVFRHNVLFDKNHFLSAMDYIVRNPNVNSTIIMRTDVMKEIEYKLDSNPSGPVESIDKSKMKSVKEYEVPDIDEKAMPLSCGTVDCCHDVPQSNFLILNRRVVRRIIPKSPLRDPIIHQSCLYYSSEAKDAIFIVYLGHFKSEEECPFYLPPSKAVGILYYKKTLCIYYLLFDPKVDNLVSYDQSDRMIRIALHLLETSYKHSTGTMNGYKKRIHHDQLVDKIAFQDQYLYLKQKYANTIVQNWVESTDPRKHVFEDLSIAAFLIELWNQMFKSKQAFQFLDLGCGNGLLVHILISEGFQGEGIDARTRKSWATYSEHVQSHLHQQVVVPKHIIRDEDLKRTYIDSEGCSHHYEELLKDPGVNLLDLPANTFIIGNHPDELTMWIPLLGRPFLIIPCCSYNLAGQKYRYSSTMTPGQKFPSSTYASLCDHVGRTAAQLGWVVEKEVLRIPSTRNIALIGRTRLLTDGVLTPSQVIQHQGGTEGWIENTMALKLRNPRNH